ncbi:hypothetical protein JOF48_003314 [Arthrobacter stackebrandtii]|uniref:DUF1059 domain-containing protein n=1 Tax=Arthrobacter stackebrandtii TaxID=272161 RepID=A0ABS4Z1A6_9MICC|nr:DUF1059 domain-containing protein [Arthrobacter stackebrandtii]MBP2414515.1 hypothetical protein [Arthrobacter stackebrandtii]PYH01631.1 DUF1059 domain-containing protein [Arthrobacter stackebrandtii]
MSRVMIDCRKVPSDIGCTLTVAGTEEEVLTVSTAHAIATHGEVDGPELQEMLRSALEPAEMSLA